MVWYHYIKRAKIEFLEIEIAVGISELLGIDKMKQEDVEFSKTLTIAPLETVSCKTLHTTVDNYLCPAVFEALAYQGDLFGIKLRLYDPRAPKDDANGLFFLPISTYETTMVPTTGAGGKKRKRTNITMEMYLSKYPFLYVLDRYGFSHLFHKSFDKYSENIRMPSSNAPPTMSQMVSLQLYLPLPALLNPSALQ